MDAFKQLETFVAVVTLGSLSAAARKEGVVPAVIGRRLDALEERLGARLLVRTTRSVTLTTVGRVFAPSAEQLLDDLDVALLGIRDVSSSRLGHVTIACVPSLDHNSPP